MSLALRLLRAEALKLRRSPALKLLITLLLFFFLADGLSMRSALNTLPQGRSGLGQLALLPTLGLQSFWLTLGNALLLALLPGLLLRPEHRGAMAKHLQAQPPSWGAQYVAKLAFCALLVLAVQLLLVVGLRLEWWYFARQHPELRIVLPQAALLRFPFWLTLGSLPVLALHFWLAERFAHAIVPVLCAFMGLLVLLYANVDPDQAWKRDLIPWMMPPAMGTQALGSKGWLIRGDTRMPPGRLALSALAGFLLFGTAGALTSRRWKGSTTETRRARGKA